MNRKLPELLAPAGDMDCLKAAVLAGADAVYFGASGFNARQRAKNFEGETLKEAIRYLHTYGRKAYVTLNTAVKEREMSEALALASEIYEAGADAVIAADVGLIREIRRQLPGLEVHISTQAGVRSTAGAKAFAEMGATRVVLARELTGREMKSVSESCGIETEVFVHGAMCVSVSGRCLFSSLVGGRSGNRGECAQPCRLPYNKGKYLLSLKDMSLSNRIPELIETGTSSLKIEGRLKSPEYVYGVTRIYRTLLDERRNAKEEENRLLERIFSRGGFSDAYFTGKITPEMKGIRSDNPERPPELPNGEAKIPLTLSVRAKLGEPLLIRFEKANGDFSEAVGANVEKAENRPMSADDLKKPLAALGTTAYTVSECRIDCDEGIMIPLSALKALRREAIEALDSRIDCTRERILTSYTEKKHGERLRTRTAKFYTPSALTDSAREYFDTVFIPAEFYDGKNANGAFLPECAYEKDNAALASALSTLREKGCERIMVSDIGELYEAKKHGFCEIHTDIGFNVYNSACAEELRRMGATRILTSAELNLPAAKGLFEGITVYGRIPLMILKKCIGRELIGCDACKKSNGAFLLKDRKGITFPGMRDSGFRGSEHGSILFNSLPTYIGDKTRGDSALTDTHFIFTTESPREVDSLIKAQKNGEALPFPVRRI